MLQKRTQNGMVLQVTAAVAPGHMPPPTLSSPLNRTVIEAQCVRGLATNKVSQVHQFPAVNFLSHSQFSFLPWQPSTR